MEIFSSQLIDNNDIKVDCEENIIEDDSARIIEDTVSNNENEIEESDER